MRKHGIFTLPFMRKNVEVSCFYYKLHESKESRDEDDKIDRIGSGWYIAP